MKLLLNFKVMRALGLLFHLVPNAAHLDGAWAKGYDALKAIYAFIAHFTGDQEPTAAQLEEVLHDVQANQAAAEAPAPVPAQADPAGPVSEDTLAPRAIIQA
ncbi:MAG: hypothetical protein ACRYFX_12690 [Janthinobacterium lividum]